jgi:hypothetical protein
MFNNISLALAKETAERIQKNNKTIQEELFHQRGVVNTNPKNYWEQNNFYSNHNLNP